jgi:hypothetical protein
MDALSLEINTHNKKQWERFSQQFSCFLKIFTDYYFFPQFIIVPRCSIDTDWFSMTITYFYDFPKIQWLLRIRQITSEHWLNMELNLQSLFGLHVHRCTHWLRPSNTPPPLPHLGSCECAIGQPRYVDDISLWPHASVSSEIRIIDRIQHFSFQYEQKRTFTFV